MAQNEWQAISTTANAYFTSVSGTAVQHSSVSSPITSSGTWFRSFQSSANGSEAAASLIPVNNSLLTSSLGYPYGYTYSLRCWMRIDGAAAPMSQNGASVLNFKSNSTLSAQYWINNSANNHNLKGYRVYLKQNDSTSNRCDLILRCGSSDVSSISYNSSLSPALNTFGYEATVISSMSDSTWVRARMDVMSLPDADRITVFTGSQTDTWSQLHQVDIPRTKTGAYLPWYNNPSYPSDNTGSATSGYMGILYYTNRIVTPVRFDQFEVYREPITI